MNRWSHFIIVMFASISLTARGQFGGFPTGGVPSGADLAALSNSLNQTNQSIQNATTAVNNVNTTAGQINQTVTNVNTTANRAIDTYEQQMSPQIDRALALGETTNATLNRLVDPKTLFIAGLAGAAGGALGGFLMNAAISGVSSIFQYLTTDWDAVALEVYEANISTLYEAQNRLEKLESVHAKLLANYRLLNGPLFKKLRDMNQAQRVAQVATITHDALCRHEIGQVEVDTLMSFAGQLDIFDNPEARLRSDLCRVQSLIETQRLSILQKVADIQANFQRAQYSLRERMYDSFDEAAKTRKKYLENNDIRLQRQKVALLNCIRHATGTPSIVERWNAKYCSYRGPELCLTVRQWQRRDRTTERTHETHNCIWECVPPELEDLEHLACPVSVPIPIFGIFSGPKKDCKDLRDQIRQRLDVGCPEEKAGFSGIHQTIEREIAALPNQVRAQKREVALRITQLEHTIQQIQAGGQPSMTQTQARTQYQQFLSSVCGE